ncbi:MAG: hypothetical protein Q9164_003783 [Protoblastenia rupestris]
MMTTRDHAIQLDDEDPLKHLRSEFIIPTRGDLKAKTLAAKPSDESSYEACTYLCGNSLGLQPRRTADKVAAHLNAWAKKGVLGHFTEHEDSNLAGFLHVDDQAAKLMTPVVGALPEEVAIMETLTANLHLMMASFYRPTKEKYKIILEGKAFPSDHYAVESQVTYHGFDPTEAMICIDPEDPATSTLSTAHILAAIDIHASRTALILLPGIQYYTGQYLDIETITAHAHSKGIVIGWDLAHAVGNVELSLHDWDVDFAAWCNYKYMNSGPGTVAGLFVHEKHGKVDLSALVSGKKAYRPRFAGWWGGDKAIRFEMDKHFVPIPGAQGFQVGNPSALAISALIASLEVFQLTSMSALRQKSLALTGYLEQQLLDSHCTGDGKKCPYQIITPSDPARRGAQLSIRLTPGLLDKVLSELEHSSVVVDERKPDVVRVAPAPLYNTFLDVWSFADVFTHACMNAQEENTSNEQEVVGLRGREEKGWSQIK